MTHLIVESEGDMEYGIEYAINVATTKGGSEQVRISFPSEDFMSIFMTNLFKEFIINKVPKDNGLDLIMEIPKDETY